MDDLWFSEYHTPDVRFSIRVSRQLYYEQSAYQQIAVFDSPEFGRFLALDGVLMLTERDEFIYHEMIVHVPMAVNPDIKRVLVVGAGDGGAARELVKYKGIECIDIVEIDERVVEVCRKFLPKTACGFEDERIKLYFADGLKFIRYVENSYDLIIVDSTDPAGPGEVLFTKEFYGNCHKSLTEYGMLVNQHESSFYKDDARSMKSVHKRISGVFRESFLYQAHIPTYPSGYWLFGFASKGFHPLKDLDAEYWDSLGIKTGYYNTELHKGAFCLPNYVKEMIREDG